MYVYYAKDDDYESQYFGFSDNIESVFDFIVKEDFGNIMRDTFFSVSIYKSQLNVDSQELIAEFRLPSITIDDPHDGWAYWHFDWDKEEEGKKIVGEAIEKYKTKFLEENRDK